MIFTNSKYLFFKQPKALLTAVIVLCCSLMLSAQNKDSANTKSNLFFYHTATQNKTAHLYSKLQYERPNNQLMSWPDYPLTTTQIEQRNKQWEQDNKLTNKIAKDIITSLLSKKKKIAVIPQF